MADDMLDGLSEKETYDVLVIGGGAAGLAGAIKAQELGMKVIVIENGERIGGITAAVHPSGIRKLLLRGEPDRTGVCRAFDRQAERNEHRDLHGNTCHEYGYCIG